LLAGKADDRPRIEAVSGGEDPYDGPSSPDVSPRSADLELTPVPDERFIYFDHHATTPCDPRVVEAMLPTFRDVFANASSSHAAGRAALELVENARAEVAALLDCDAREIVFTSGATESINLALKGVAALAGPGAHIVTSTIEHRAVLDACAALERDGLSVTYLPVDADGCVRPSDVENAIGPRTILVSIMAANNEIGTLQPIEAIGAITRRRGVLLHCDATQAIASLSCKVDAISADLLSLSAHKIYGPKGSGALFVRRRRPRARLRPLFDGGGHERGLRSGTLNVPGIVGLGVAAKIVREEREPEAARIRALRDRLLEILKEAIPDLIVNGSLARRLPGNLNITFPGARASTIVASLADVAVSAGSACSSPKTDGSSYVLRALGRKDAALLGGVRIGIGRTNTEDEIEVAAQRVIEAVGTARARFGEESRASSCEPA